MILVYIYIYIYICLIRIERYIRSADTRTHTYTYTHLYYKDSEIYYLNICDKYTPIKRCPKIIHGQNMIRILDTTLCDPCANNGQCASSKDTVEIKSPSRLFFFTSKFSELFGDSSWRYLQICTQHINSLTQKKEVSNYFPWDLTHSS